MTFSGLYAGIVTHQRFRPKPHHLRYRMAQILFDLDEIDGLAARNRLFAHNRFAPVSFHDQDYGDRSKVPLRQQVTQWLQSAGINDEGGPVRLLAMPRIFGHVFNPIATWFVHRLDGALIATVYEVTNTFHDRHFYVVPVMPDAHGVIRQSAVKALYVSPFMDMAMDYGFALLQPGETVSLTVTGSDAQGKMIVASFTARRRVLNDATLLRLLLTQPLMTFKVVAGIHWEALKLWVKGHKIRRHPAPVSPNLTIGTPLP